ncbi:hypothetical protein IIB50_02520 [Patescibacteria group bacterium]|nr:hypothetical protein [Patescibacteria group bacterium]
MGDIYAAIVLLSFLGELEISDQTTLTIPSKTTLVAPSWTTPEICYEEALAAVYLAAKNLTLEYLQAGVKGDMRWLVDIECYLIEGTLI